VNRIVPPLLLAASLAAAPTTSRAQDVPAAKVRVQVVLRDADHLSVYHASRGSVVGGLLVPFFNVGNAIKADARGDKLTAAVGDYVHALALETSFERVLPARYPVFEVDAVAEGGLHATDRELAQHAREAGFRYVLLVDETFTGLSSGSVVADTDQVSVMQAVKLELFDADDGKRLWKSRLVAGSLARSALAPALESGDFFRTNYPAVADMLATLVVGSLFRDDQLHAMAASAGQGEQVPAVSSVLARYDDAIAIHVEVPKGWHELRMNSPYVKVIEPKSELRFKMGVRAEIDLLVSEFAQDVATVDEYMAAAATRMGEAGMDTATLTPFAGDTLAIPPGYSAWTIRRQDGTGGQVMFVKLLEKPYIAVLTVVATEDLDGLVAANREALEAAVLGSTVAVDRGRGGR
jgi:hypothetical protein